MTKRLIRPISMPVPGATRSDGGGRLGRPPAPEPVVEVARQLPPEPHPAPTAPEPIVSSQAAEGTDPRAPEAWSNSAERTPRPPLAELLDPQAPPQWSYAISSVDRSGRVTDRSIVRAIGWGPGDRLTITGWRNEAVIVRRESGGTIVISDQGYLHIPSGLRRRCAVRSGDRVLVAAHERLDTVIVYTMSTLDRLVAVKSEGLLFGVRA